MITKQFSLVVAVAMTFVAVSTTSASEFQSTDVPNDAKWYLHVNLDALRGTETLDEIDEVQDEIQQAGIPLMPYSWLQERYGLEEGDIHGLTFYGKAMGQKHRVAVLHADFSKEKVVDVVETQPQYRTSKHGSYTLYTWSTRDRDEKARKHHPDVTLAIKDDKAIMTASEDSAKSALDLLEGKEESLSEESLLLAGDISENIFVRGAFLRIEKAEDKPILNQALMMMNRTGFTIGASEDQMIVNLSMQADDDEKAKDAQKLLIGLHAAAQIAAVENSGVETTEKDSSDKKNKKVVKRNEKHEGLVTRLPRTFDMTSQRKGNELVFTLKSNLDELQAEVAEYFEQRQSKRVEQKVAKPVADPEPYPGKDVPGATPVRPESK